MTNSQAPNAIGDSNKLWDSRRDLILRLVPPTPTFAGVCLAGLSLFGVHPRLAPRADTYVDELLILNALLFLTALLLTLIAVRVNSLSVALRVSYWVENIFTVALLLLALVTLLMGFSAFR